MVPKMKRSLSVWVCGLSVVVRTQALWWNTFMPSMHSSGGSVYEAGVSLSSLFKHSLSLSFSPTAHLLPWQRCCMASASHFVGRVWNPTLAPGVTFHAWLKCPAPSPCPAVTRLRWDRRSGSKAELLHRARSRTPSCGAYVTSKFVRGHWMGQHLKTHD